MRITLISIFAGCVALAGPAPAAAGGLFSATGQVIAILAGDLFVGQAEGHLNGSGTLAIHSQKHPELTCVGKFTSSAALGGTGQLSCSDGASGTFRFQRLDAFHGYGVATFSRGAMSFAYGFTPDEVGPYVRLPEGKKFMHTGSELALVDQ